LQFYNFTNLWAAADNFAPAQAWEYHFKLNVRFGVNAAKLDFVQRRGRGIVVETKFKMFSAPSGAAYSDEMIFRRCRSDGAFRNRGNFLQRFRS
jgi:hypothetical protein